MSVKISKADVGDIPVLLRIQKRAFAPLYEQYKDDKNPYLQTEQELESRVTKQDGCYYKISYEDSVCGGVFVYQKESTHRIGIIYIDPNYQNKGLAQRALEILFDLYSEAKVWELDVPSDQIANIKCYTKMGFVDTGKREKINDKLTLAYYERTT